MVGISVKIFVTIILIVNYQLFQLIPYHLLRQARISHCSQRTMSASPSSSSSAASVSKSLSQSSSLSIINYTNYFRTTFSDKHVSRTALNECPSEPPLLSKLQKRQQERNGKNNCLSKFVKLTTTTISEIKPPKLIMIAYMWREEQLAIRSDLKT